MTSSRSEADLLEAAVRDRIGAPVPAIENYGWPDKVELAVIDAVLSIRANYGNTGSTGVRGATHRYQASRGGSTCNDLRFLAATDPTELGQILANRQKSAGRLKSDLIVEVAGRLEAAGVKAAADVAPKDNEQRLAWCGVHGLGSVTWAYFGMLVGRPGVKVDRMIQRFVSFTLDRRLDEREATDLVTEVAGRLGAGVADLDHAIWRYQRGQRG